MPYYLLTQDAVLSRALDVGCSVGRISFELATAFDEVVGVDTCKISLGKANLLKSKGEATYKVDIEGQITSERKAIVNPDIVSYQCNIYNVNNIKVVVWWC